MANVQKKSSLRNEKNQCTCKSFDELQKIDLIIAEMEKTTVGKIPSTTGETSDKIRMLHGFIKKMINAASMLADQKKQLNKNLKWWMKQTEYWQKSTEDWREKYLKVMELDEITYKNIQGKVDTKPGEEKIIRMGVNKN